MHEPPPPDRSPDSSHDSSPDPSTRLTLVERACQSVILLLGAICAYGGRNAPFGIDGLAYMDVARAYLRHDLHIAINGYWGPLYSWLLAVGMWIFGPGMRGELILVHALNYALFVTALVTFTIFWRAIAAWSRRTSTEGICLADAAPIAWRLIGYMMFLATFTWSINDITPDILVASVVFAVSAQLFKIETALLDPTFRSGDVRNGWVSYLLLGGLLAIGYYAKAILLYFALFILMAQSFRSKRFHKAIAATLAFMVLVAPFEAVLSRTLGHISAGDSGRLNYAWFVDGPETKTWMRADAAAPLPFYPGPTVFGSPRVFRVSRMEGVTYAPWYDAARFDTRSRPVLNLRSQLHQIAINLKFVKEQVLGTEAALVVPLLILMWHTPKRPWRRLAATWFCTLPALSVVGLYLLTHLVMRFVLGFFLVLWGAAFASISVSAEMRPLARRALLAGTLVFAAIELPGLLHFAISQPAESAERDIAIAGALASYGLHAGDSVASLGDGQEAYWAHWAGTPVVAEVWKMDSAPFWAGSPVLQQAALRSMADAGARAAVWRRDSDRACPPRWVSLPADSGCLVLLPAEPPPN